MNEQISRLIKQATNPDYDSDDGPMNELNLEKFAELIVKECANTANEWQTSEHPGLLCKNVILDHFGIKE